MEYDIEKNNPDWIIDGPWYNTSICEKSHGTVFENFIINSITDRYNLMCYIDSHYKQYPSSVDYGSSVGGNVLSSKSTT